VYVTLFVDFKRRSMFLFAGTVEMIYQRFNLVCVENSLVGFLASLRRDLYINYILLE
jgi:hypothetical protein